MMGLGVCCHCRSPECRSSKEFLLKLLNSLVGPYVLMKSSLKKKTNKPLLKKSSCPVDFATSIFSDSVFSCSGLVWML